MMIQTPPMGCNSWNTIGHNINEDVILENAEALVKTGLKDCGYNYVVIDDCWSLRARDKNGYLVADPEKFPHGMKALSDDNNKMRLKFGMYSCCGYKTCAGYPGSYTHEFQDAKTFASWDVDLLKYDYCWKPATVSGADLFRRMGEALATCGRDILFSAKLKNIPVETVCVFTNPVASLALPRSTGHYTVKEFRSLLGQSRFLQERKIDLDAVCTALRAYVTEKK